MAVDERPGADDADADAEHERRAEQSGAREIEREVAGERGLVGADEHEHAAECEEGREAERKHALASDHAEIEPGGLGHHARIPGRIPDEIELHVA